MEGDPAVDIPPFVSAVDLGRRISELSDDKYEGRAPGTPGGRAAAQYIADEMKAAGLEPMGIGGTYYQPMKLTGAITLPSSTMTIANSETEILVSDQDTNSVFWTKRLDKTLSVKESELVFVGYGIIAPEFGWNDYAGLDVKGKTVVMLVNDPGFATGDENLFKGNAMTYYGRWTYKFEEAGRQGATAALVVHETEPASYGWEVVSGSWTGTQYDLVRPDGGASRVQIEGWLHYDAAKAVFEAAGMDIEVQKETAMNRGFTPVAMKGLTLDATLDQTIQTVESSNVAGGITGTRYPDEYVLYMAHWDHLGKNPDLTGDNIYNGAVDNATGTAAIIEIGEAFVQRGKPERSAIFIAVTAEESGLLGSSYYSEDPLVPLDKTVAGINIDAILPVGKTRDMIVVGYGSSELEDRLGAILESRNMYIVPDPTPEAGYYYRSDHISLAKLGVPMLYADSGRDHVINGTDYGEAFSDEYVAERYHKPGDEYDSSWDLSGLEQSTEILFELGYDLANSRDWPNWYEGTEFRSLRDNMMAR
ncbi:MAG: M28 family peptidase [Hyphomonadaceae bacterium]|nr:M28 family peptidase [Hyphomonadaceae bacterium]